MTRRTRCICVHKIHGQCMWTCIHWYMQSILILRMCMHTHTYTHTQTLKHIHTHTYMSTHIHTHSLRHTHKHTEIYIHTHTHTGMYKQQNSQIWEQWTSWCNYPTNNKLYISNLSQFQYSSINSKQAQWIAIIWPVCLLAYIGTTKRICCQIV